MTWYDRNDPRFRRTINQITSNLETANETAQVRLFSFSENYLKPCFGSIGESLKPCLSTLADSLQPCLAQCYPQTRNDRRGPGGRHRAPTRGRLEHSFDFYDDWEEDENDALLALDDDEFDRVVGSADQQFADSPASPSAQQPGRRKIFDYGSVGIARRKTIGEAGHDPTIIPNSSYFGFLDKLPFKVGRRNLRYKPSAADLQERQEHSGKMSTDLGDEIYEGDEEASTGLLGYGRKRSGTAGSGHTTDSYSSRGDLFPSDDEEADAVALDDEFTASLTRRGSADDASSGRGKFKKGKRPSTSRRSTRKSMPRAPSGTSRSSSDNAKSPMSEIENPLPTIEDLRKEERGAVVELEGELEKKREAARRLAMEKGLAFASDASHEHEPEQQQPHSQDERAELKASEMDTKPAAQGG